MIWGLRGTLSPRRAYYQPIKWFLSAFLLTDQRASLFRGMKNKAAQVGYPQPARPIGSIRAIPRCSHSHCKKFARFGPQKIQRDRCNQCQKTALDRQEKPLDEMRVSLEKTVQALTLSQVPQEELDQPVWVGQSAAHRQLNSSIDKALAGDAEILGHQVERNPRVLLHLRSLHRR